MIEEYSLGLCDRVSDNMTTTSRWMICYVMPTRLSGGSYRIYVVSSNCFVIEEYLYNRRIFLWFV